MNNKGNSSFNFLKTAALAFVVITVIIVIGTDVTENVKSNQCAGSGLDVNNTFWYNTSTGMCMNASYSDDGGTPVDTVQVFPHSWNISNTGMNSQIDLAENLTTIATVVGAVILLGFLGVKLFGKRR